MADIRMKLFTLAGVATVFAGTAFGQATCSNPQANAVFVRAEGTTEQVADVTITCAVAAAGTAVTAGQIANITVYMSPSVNVTSATLGSGNGAPNESSAGIDFTPTTYCVAANAAFPCSSTAKAVQQGSVSGNTVTFSGIFFPALAPGGASLSITITNIKINASTIATSSGVPTSVTETMFLSGTAVVPTVLTSPAVAFATNGLTSVKANNAGSNPICNVISAVTTNFDKSGGDGKNGTVQFSEGFATAFKSQGLNTVNTTLGSEFSNNTETGYGFAGNSATNTASSGTRVLITFNNIPNNVTVYVPTVINRFDNAATPAVATSTITLTTSTTGAFSAVPVTTGVKGSPGAADDTHAPAAPFTAALTAANGSATAVYEETLNNISVSETYSVDVYLLAAAGALPAPATAVTATVSFAPIGSSSNAPNFVSGSSTTTVNLSNFTACSTTLLFPFVTNQSGFESGLAISNTSSDLLGGKSGAPANSIASQSGTCVLTFFGNATAASNPPAFTTAAPVPSGTSWTGTLTSVTGGTPNTFGGYMIAQCNFLFAHGFTYISYNIGQASGMAMGYVAETIGTPRATPSTAAPEVTGR